MSLHTMLGMPQAQLWLFTNRVSHKYPHISLQKVRLAEKLNECLRKFYFFVCRKKCNKNVMVNLAPLLYASKL